MYDYLEAVKEDVKDYLRENIDNYKGLNSNDLKDQLNADLWEEDRITGNASGSYFCNSYKAFECLFGNEYLLEEIENEFGPISSEDKYNWEALDVSIRCYVLNDAIYEALDELEEEGFINYEEEEDL